MAISGAVVAKVATTVLSNNKTRKGLGWIFAVVLSPIIVIVAIMCGIASGASQHNKEAIDICFFGGSLTDSVPKKYTDHIKAIQSSFTAIDIAVTAINKMIESGPGLDSTEIKSIFYSIYFGTDDVPNKKESTKFVDNFVSYELTTKTCIDENGNSAEEIYTVATSLSRDKAYSNIKKILGLDINDGIINEAKEVSKRISDNGTAFSGDILRGNSMETKIDVSEFTDKSTKNNIDLVAYAKQAWENQWGYVYGTFGDILTSSLLQSKLNQYPDNVGVYISFIKQKWLNRPTTDCVGLIKGYGWLDSTSLAINYGTNGMPDISANQMYNSAKVKGSISTMPDTIGLGVWHEGHIGVYIGDGYVIEAMGTKYGVVKTKLDERSFTAWLEIPYIDYE